jgi:hypothetical protein
MKGEDRLITLKELEDMGFNSYMRMTDYKQRKESKKVLYNEDNIIIEYEKGGNYWGGRGVTSYVNSELYLYFRINQEKEIYLGRISYSQGERKKYLDIFKDKNTVEALVKPYLEKGKYYYFDEDVDLIKSCELMYIEFKEADENTCFDSEQSLKDYYSDYINKEIGSNKKSIEHYYENIETCNEKISLLQNKLKLFQ